MSRFYLCVVLAMTAQMLLLLVWSFLGPESRLNGIMDSVYGSVARSIGTLFFEEQMSLGNIGLGLSLLFLTVMLYSAAAGAIIYLGYRVLRRICAAPEKRDRQ